MIMNKGICIYGIIWLHFIFSGKLWVLKQIQGYKNRAAEYIARDSKIRR